MGVGVVIVAAGSGSRLGSPLPKAFVPVGAHPLLWYAASAALRASGVRALVVAVPLARLAAACDLLEPLSRRHAVPVQVVPGGAERGDSVLIGMSWLPEDCEVVLVHDAARAFAPAQLFARVAEAVTDQLPAVVPTLPVVDTIKQVDGDRVVRTLERATLRIVQTPQGFRRDVLEEAHTRHGSLATDDAGLVELLARPVGVVEGHPDAFKITTPADLERAERLVADMEWG